MRLDVQDLIIVSCTALRLDAFDLRLVSNQDNPDLQTEFDKTSWHEQHNYHCKQEQKNGMDECG